MVYTYLKTAIQLVFLATTVSTIACRTGETAKTKEYTEEHRNQFHFSPMSNWMNDPNGMVYYEGEYHLFYQYYPDSNVWGPMHWGHAVSDDLIFWEHLPIALYPDSLGDIFSGSAVIDWNNTSGFAKDATRPPMVAFFTHHYMEGEKSGTIDFQYQSLAYSLDKGRTWTKYSGNPIIDNPGIKDFRDPKVIWDGDQWVMVFAAFDRIKFYTSDNLKDWVFSSDFGLGYGAQGRPWECPDLFPLISDDGQIKWVLIVSIGRDAFNGGSGTQYFIGDWNGEEFVNDSGKDMIKWLDFGKDNYAGVTWSDIPEEDGRRIFIGWMSNWQYAQVVPTNVWRSAMTLPRELTLSNVNGDYIITQQPVTEIKILRNETVTLSNGIVNESIDLLGMIQNPNGNYELELTLKRSDSTTVSIDYSNDHGNLLSVGFDPNTNKYFVDRTLAGKSEFSDDFAGLHQSNRLSYSDEYIDLHLFIDRASIELFADNGKVVITEIFFAKDEMTKLELRATGGPVQLLDGKIHALKSIW